jgi:hypothetical protein
MFRTKVVVKIKTHYLCLITLPPPPRNRAFYGIKWKNIVERGRPQMTIWRIASWVPKATNAHSECVINTSTAIVVVRTSRNVTLYIHCPSCLVLVLVMTYCTVSRLIQVSSSVTVAPHHFISDFWKICYELRFCEGIYKF